MDSLHLPRRLLLAGFGSAAVTFATDCDSHRATSATPTTTPRPSGTSSAGEAALRRKIASLLVAGFRGTQVTNDDWIVKAIKGGLGGVILFDQDLETKSEEGGRTSRLNPSNGFPATKSEADIGAENSPAATRDWARGLVADLTRIGANFNYTPVVDLNINPESRAIAKLGRSFSADPNVVVSNATEEIQAHRAAAVKTNLKHFPGLGSAAHRPVRCTG